MATTLQATLTDEQVRRLAAFLAPHDFPHLATALRQATHSILGQWRTQTMKVLPHLDDMSVKEFEDDLAIILSAIAEAMETKDPMAVRSLIDKAPEHGFDRFLQKYDPHDLFTEERILRKVIVVELDAQMGRPATKEEATALHELLDIMSHFALLSLYRKRTAEARELAERASRNERLAALGTLALGVGHDLSNMLLPLQIRIDVLKSIASPVKEAADHLKVMEIIAKGMNDLSKNLCYLAADSDRSGPAQETTDLSAWCPDFQKFFRPIIEGPFVITCDVPANLPTAPISRAALSQAMFNLLKNAAEALRDQPNGHIILSARARSDCGVRLVVTDNGPGMPAEVREHCFEPFYTTRVRGTQPGSGLGLAIVNALLTKAGATIEVHSPPPMEVLRDIPSDVADEIRAVEPRGTAFVIDLPAAPSAIRAG